MNYKTIISDLEKLEPIIIRFDQQRISTFRWEPESAQYFLPDQRNRLPRSEIEQVMKSARSIMRKKNNHHLKRRAQGRLTNKSWSENLAKVCQARCDLQLFLENGGLDKNYELQAAKRLDDIDLVSVREKRAAQDGAYINSLVQRIESGALNFGRPEDFNERVNALLSDAIERFSEWHGPEISDRDTKHQLDYLSDQED